MCACVLYAREWVFYVFGGMGSLGWTGNYRLMNVLVFYCRDVPNLTLQDSKLRFFSGL